MSLAHRARAVEYVQPAVLDLVSQSSPAMFAFAGLTTIYSFAEATLSSPKEDDWIQHMLDCFKLSRGISAITRLHREGLEQSSLSALLSYHSQAEFDILREMGLRFEQYSILEKIIESHESRTQERQVYIRVAKWCLDFITLLSQSPEGKNFSHLINAWPNMISDLFVQLLEAREPIALLIIAHYAAMLSLRPTLWWTSRWSDLLLDQIEGLITNREMHDALAWPRHVAKPRSKG